MVLEVENPKAWCLQLVVAFLLYHNIVDGITWYESKYAKEQALFSNKAPNLILH
jgi:hypothetical protein